MSEHVFALDIGTQSVTGVLLKERDSQFEVIDFCSKQHGERAMLDGQIHNVVQVAEIIKQVKNELEKKHGPLHKVCVAAAGRALKTIQAEKTIQIQNRPITSVEEIKHLELSAVQNAQLALINENDESVFTNYHCVGYSVLHYKLDGEIIGSFIDQIGDEATVEIIATFLPKIVVKSLLAALDRANLSMEALTLEPIAAIDVLIPDSMRKLNVALIDIGAGTSDIAITNYGTVTGYSMVPIAGDEITEAISNEYILDFKVAEQAKQKIVMNNQAEVKDILGFEHTITYKDLVPKIMENIKNLANLLANEIRSLNRKAPQAVMLIGGGSLTPQLSEQLAASLQLPENRVGVRGIEAIQHLHQNDILPSGPDFVTPIGIAISAKNNPIHYVSVYVNDTIIRMFEMKQLTVGDCLIQAGIEVNKYYGRPGLAMIVYVNGKEVVLRGKFGEQPKIYLNNSRTNVNSFIKSEDKIVIKKGRDGADPKYSIEDIVGPTPEVSFYLNGEKQTLYSSYMVNDKPVTKDYIVKDKDNIVVNLRRTIQDFLKSDLVNIKYQTKPITITVNNEQINVENSYTKFILNGKSVDLSANIKGNDQLEIIPPKKPTVKTVLDQLNKQYWNKIKVYFHDNLVELKQQQLSIIRNGADLSLDDDIYDGDILTLKEHKFRPFIFQDIFRYVDIDLTSISGDYQLYRNDEASGFHDEIVSGDHLEIK